MTAPRSSQLLHLGLGLGITWASLALSSSALAQFQVPAGSQSLSGPAVGVLCDAAGPVCYDAQGPSIGHTQTYFGRTAADRLGRELASRAAIQEFRLSNGAVCDVRAKICWSDGYGRRTVASQLTRQLFGNTNPANLGELQLPQAGVLCDRREQRCYDRQGLSVGLTREYFGAYAEQQLVRQLAGQAPAKVFRLSNGAVCDVDAQRCWSDGWDRRTVDTTLSRQLFGQENGSLARQAQCRLSRWFRTLSSGNCEISERTGPRGRQVDVSLADGTTYSFSNVRGEGYRITDSKGSSWPVRVNDQGNTLTFSWSDRVLQVTPQRTGSSSAQNLLQLLDAILSN
jgi:uncharacterized protein (DUF779 family)